MEDHASNRALTQRPTDSRHEEPRKSGAVLKWFASLSQQAGSVPCLNPQGTRAAADLRSSSALRRPQAPGLLGRGHGLSEAAAGEGPRRPLSNQACPPDSPCGLQALGSRSATKHHFTGFCDICLVFNAEPGPKGWRRRAGMQGPEF